MKNCIRFIVLLLLYNHTSLGQLDNKNRHLIQLQPQHILDDKLTNISFAYSFRVLNSEYNGPLVRLRKGWGLNSQQKDFGWSDNDIVDLEAIDTWSAGSNVYVHTWYDQSGMNRDAVQTNIFRQPRFYYNLATPTEPPYFAGDGFNDYLEVTNGNIQVVTNSGRQGTVLAAIRAEKKQSFAFGVRERLNRWSAHVNWTDNNFYFDPGGCCNNTRNFDNSSNLNLIKYYTMMRGTLGSNSTTTVRESGIQKFNDIYNNGACTLSLNFTICRANGTNGYYSKTGFSEFIMYNMDIEATKYSEIEDNAMLFWGI